MKLKKLVDDIKEGYVPSENELSVLLSSNGSLMKYLFKKANDVRKIFLGDVVHIRGIIEFSNYCRCRCTYCGLNRDNKNIQRYRMDPTEIINTAREAFNVGYKTLVLQSGEDFWYTRDMISWIIREIKAFGDIAITLSVGERPFEDCCFK